MARLLFKKNKMGFTLVELLIVMAIIGVLSTIGVPAFRRMIQKSKKSEAKVALGGLYTSEQAFFSEYGAYGNNLPQVGFEMEGQDRRYAVGFIAAGCAHLATTIPDEGNVDGIAVVINNSYPQYYTSDLVSFYDATPINNTGCVASINNVGGMINGAATSHNADVFDSDGGEANAFLATAQGVISSNVERSTAAAGQLDIWAINENRQIRNTHDGGD